ncbi:CC-NBS-LRR resistance protein, partial [Trifolium medium]|nr:CC-NBS-LRR resistance protein [Trifolium medium]
SFFEVILERLASGDFNDYFSRNNLDVELVDKLSITLNSINQVLEEAEKMQYKSTYVKKWLDDLKDAIYEADQISDEIATDAQLNKLKAESDSVTSTTFESRIKELIGMLELLVKQKEILGLKGGARCASNEGGISWKSLKKLPTTLPEDKANLHGRDVEKEEIIKFLLSDNDGSNRVPVLSIVGLGGMGKTTLAEVVYNDYRIKEHFERIAWVYVSEYFDVVRLTNEIISRLDHSLADGEDLNQLQQELHQRITGKKYLLVLDDVRNGKDECWEQLLLPFNHGSFGSKIIVTTRDKEVASVMKSAQILHLKQLEESDCWSLFVRHAFYGKNVSEYPNLESIGRKIVDKCGGSPLAVRTLGDLLRMKFSADEW